MSKENKVAPVINEGVKESLPVGSHKEDAHLLDKENSNLPEDIKVNLENLAIDDAEKAKWLEVGNHNASQIKVGDVVDKKKKRASAWFMGAAVLLVTSPDDGCGDYKKEFANKDIAEEWVRENLKTGEVAEILVTYKKFLSKKVVVNQIVED